MNPGPVGDIDEMERERVEYMGCSILNGSDNDLALLLSIYLQEPESLPDNESFLSRVQRGINRWLSGFYVQTDYDHSWLIADWINAWILLEPERSIAVIEKKVRTDASCWVPLLKFAANLGCPEGRIWVNSINQKARDTGAFTSEIEALSSHAINNIIQQENSPWNDSEQDRQQLLGTFQYGTNSSPEAS